MKANPRIIAAIAISAGFGSWFAPSGEATETRFARLTFVTGEVFRVEDSRKTPAVLGQKLAESETLETGKNGAAILTLSTGARLKLAANTRMKLSHLSSPDASGSNQQNELELDSGALFSQVPKLRGSSKFLIRTKTVVMGVRGTEFFASDRWMCVHEGTVAVSTPKAPDSPVLVKQGQGVFIPKDAAITPPRDYEWTHQLNWNMDPAQGDVQDHTAVDSAYAERLLRHDYD